MDNSNNVLFYDDELLYCSIQFIHIESNIGTYKTKKLLLFNLPLIIMLDVNICYNVQCVNIATCLSKADHYLVDNLTPQKTCLWFYTERSVILQPFKMIDRQYFF